MMELIKGQFKTFTGKKFDAINPKEELIDIFDIARGLSFNCHFGGHTKEFFSIAQHSVMTLKQYEKECKETQTPIDLDLQKACLFHDASEAYIGDMIKPIKVLLPNFQILEDGIQSAIFRRYEIPIEYLKKVKPYDIVVQEMEYKTFHEGGNFIHEYWGPNESESHFIHEFAKLFF